MRTRSRTWLVLAGALAALAIPAAASAKPSAGFLVKPAHPTTDQAVTFRARGCDAAPCAYRWADEGPDGAGGATWPLGRGRTLRFSFGEAGTKRVRLTVTNARGARDTTVKRIRVRPAGTAAPKHRRKKSAKPKGKPETTTKGRPKPATEKEGGAGDPQQDSCTVSSAAELQARAADGAAGVCTVKGAIGDVTISARPAQTVTFRGDPTASFAQVTFAGAANITLDHARVTDSIVLADRSGTTHNDNVRLTHLQIGGTPTARTMPAALVWIGPGNDNITIDHSELAWTNAGNTGNQGYAIRALNGDRDLIDGLNVIDNKIHHIGADALQLAGVARLRLERNDIAYIAAEPGSTEHSDSLQILSLAGTTPARILRNHIHHVGYYTENAQPADNYPAGQLIIHGWSDTPVLFQDNLLHDNRNYAPLFKTESDGSVADNWTFDHNTIIRQGPPQPSANRAGYFSGHHTLTNNILARLEGNATWTTASGNIIRFGRARGARRDRSLKFDKHWRSIDHPKAGIRQPAGPDW